MSPKPLVAAIAATLVMMSAARAAEQAPAGDKAVDLDKMQVIGHRQSRQVQTLLPENMVALPPGASVQKALNMMPGVNMQSVDALGVNEQSLSLSVRGFNTTRLGYTLDGMPLGDGAYNNYNGLSISRALIPENLSRADLSMGIANLGIASTSNLGGAVTYFSGHPAHDLSVRASQSFGSNGNRRTFARLDTGQFGGFSAYVSGMDSRSELYVDQRAYNTSYGRQFNGKLVYDFDRGSISAFGDYSRTSQANDFYMSKDALARLGWDWGGYAPDWDKALSRAYCNPGTLVAALCDKSGPDTYADGAFTGGQVLRDDDLYYVAADYSPTDSVDLHAQVYHHENKGAGNNWNYGWSNRNTPEQLPLLLRDTRYSIDRSGALFSAGWEIGIHHLQVGYWQEDNTSSAERYSFTNVTGPRSLNGYLAGQPNTGTFAQETTWRTRQYYVQDTLHLMEERLLVDFGFKSTDSRSDAAAMPGIAKTPISPTSSGQFATGSLRARDRFLPQVGVRFEVSPDQELFASYAENIAMFQGGFKLGPQAVSQAVWDSQGEPLKPERSTSLEGGYRVRMGDMQASVAAYTVKFEDRLLQYNPCNSREPNGPGCGNRFYNVGGVDSKGLELALMWQPAHWLDWYNSLSLNHSTYNDDYIQDGVLRPTAGKRQVDTPDKMFASALTLRDNHWFASLQGKYTGRRYYTYTNDQGFGGFTVFDLGAGYDFGAVGRLSGMKVSMNVANVTNKRYVANLDTSVFAPVDPNGTVVVAHSSAPRQVFMTLGLAF
ncbi:MAG: TonB-dependent receptor [Proteobacteria bacterium]|nr:TonB-dependent receptor [Pseudomonadota bacterium]